MKKIILFIFLIVITNFSYASFPILTAEIKDIPIGKKLTPYFGIGIGNSNITHPDKTITGTRGDDEYTETVKGGEVNNFVYNVKLGANYPVTDNVSVYSEASMLSIPSYTLNDASYKASKEYSINAGVKIKL